MALINPPLAYTANLPIRADQLACGVKDILWQTYGSDVAYHCGGSNVERYGLTPVTLYGLPSVEVQFSLSRLDGRLQVTNSSPANPHGLFSDSQHPQWTAGAGYSFPNGFHVGVSGFTGPYLDNNLESLLPTDRNLQNYAATGVGIDATWSSGPWSAQGEWMHFDFALPGFVASPSQSAAYAQVKRILTPRVFAAGRVNFENFGPIKDQPGVSAIHFAGPQQLYELTIGYRLNRVQIIKAGVAWQHGEAWTAAGSFWPEIEGYALELQLVTNFTAVSKAFR